MSVNEPKRWPLVTSLKARQPGNLPPLDAGLVNCWAEYNPQDESWTIEKRPGTSLHNRYDTVNLWGLGLYNFEGVTIIVASNSSGGVLENSVTYIGDTSKTPYETPNIFYGVRFVQTDPETIVYGSGAGTYTYNATVGQPQDLGPLSLGTYPPTGNFIVPGFAYLDGTLYVMDNEGNIYGSAIQDITTWSALNVIQANEAADDSVYLTKYLGLYVAALKERTVQFFYDNANPTGSPLAPLKGSSLPIGCMDPRTVQEIDDATMIWVAADASRQPKIAMLSNMNLSIVSDPAIEKLLSNVEFFTGASLSVGSPIWSTLFRFRGHRFYVLSILTINTTLVYDIDQKIWLHWHGVGSNLWPLIAITGTYGLGLSDGILYNINGCEVYPTDNGGDVQVDIYTPNFDDGTSLGKYLSAMKFVADKLPTSMQVRCNDYDYDPTKWTNLRSVNMNLQQPALTDCGTFQRRAYNFRHNDNTAFRIKTVDLQMDHCAI